MTPFERLSGEARRVLTLAAEEAEGTRRRYLGTEHLLLGMLRVEGCLAARALAAMGLDEAAARAAVDAVTRRPDAVEALGDAVPTSRVRRVIEMAFQEAQRTRLSVVTTGALLVGLLLEPDGLAAHVLGEGAVTVDRVRGALAELAGAGVGESEAGE